MSLVLQTPTAIRLDGYQRQRPELSKLLTYVDQKVDYELSKFRHNRWFAQQHGQEAYLAKINDLKSRRLKSLLFEDDDGTTWTYSGLTNLLATTFGDTIRNEISYPAPKIIPWAKMPKFPDRYYQEEAQANLIAARHAGVEIGTGLGKSQMIRNLLKHFGLPAIVMAPSVNIAMQLYDDLVTHFGKAKVGQYFDKKKEFNKLFVVGVSASLTRVPEGSPAWQRLSQAKVFIADESHQCPAITLAKVCFGLANSAPYRFFFSGTQVRNDGLGLLLDAITGPIVYRMTVREGVDRGFLAKPNVRMVHLRSNIDFDSNDVNDLTRAHIYYNPQVIKAAADLTNKAVSLMGRPTLILVDELEQFTKLQPFLRYEARFAHGGVNASNRDKLPEQFWKSDPKTLVEQFNAGEFPILVGTSCVATGTDFQGVKCIVYLRGGKSEIEVKQGAIGRGTRKVPGKEDFLIIDFAIDNVDALKRHAKERKKLYIETYPSFNEMSI